MKFAICVLLSVAVLGGLAFAVNPQFAVPEQHAAQLALVVRETRPHDSAPTMTHERLQEISPMLLDGIEKARNDASRHALVSRGESAISTYNSLVAEVGGGYFRYDGLLVQAYLSDD